MSIKSIPHDTPEDQVCQVTPASTNVVELNDGTKIPRLGWVCTKLPQAKKRMIRAGKHYE